MKVLIPIVIGLVVVGCGPGPSIHEAAAEGNIKRVKQHLVEGVDVNAKFKDGWTPLHMAAEGGHREIVDLLIAKGADINATAGAGDGVGWTPLHEAAEEGHKKVVELLILKGADINVKNGDGRTPLDLAFKHKNAEIADILRKHGGKKSGELKAEKETPSKGEDKTSPSIVLEAKAPDTLAAQLVALSPGINEIKVEHDGRSRRLIITAPKTFSRQNLYPILFCFHGAGGKADGPSKRWSPHTDKRDLIVISAEAVQPLAKWNFRDKFHAEEHDDVGFILKVVEALVGSRLADPKTIYATGHSSGGLFCYRLAKEVAVFAALSPMSCGMVKGAHDPDEKTKFVPILQVIGDQDKSFNGSSNPKVTMYSAAKRIDVWRKFNRCGPDPVVIEKGKEIMVYTYASQSGIEVVLCKVKDQGHIIRRDLRDIADSVALDFLLKHKNTK
jgi:poly(3-hydroxybutyrate) depolymerase